jgi:Ca-activated chloride channel family protein
MTTDIAPIDTEIAPDPEGGLGALATSRGNLPLDEVDVRAAITGLSATVEVTQGFRNPFDVPLEATYIFPLPDRAAVTAMRMESAGRVVEGVLKERSQARADYDQAIAKGQRAAIAEEDRPDVFTMRVGNIAPGERVTVRLTLAQPLPYQDGEATFRFPLVVAPRYIPGTPLDGEPVGSGVAADTDAVPDASRISPPVLLPGFPNPVRLSLSAEVDPAGLPLAGIRCSLHATAEEAVAGGRTIVRLQPGERLDRDFILRLGVADPEQIATSLVLTQDPGEGAPQGTFSLTLVPSAGHVRPRPRDVVLVLDRSGSMGGWKMVAARRAAARIVDTLTDADQFAVLCFDNAVERFPELSAGLARATDRNRFRAIERLARTDAQGGTEMLQPLADAVRLLTAGGPAAARDRVLVLVTDGQVGNEDQILSQLGRSLDQIRVHVIGIDRAVNESFLSRLAGAGRGRCELVESEDRLDEAAALIHRRIGAPLVAALALAADGLRIEPGTVAPSRLPDLFPGVPVTVTGRWSGQAGGAVTVCGAAADGGPFEVKAVAVTGGTPASTASWARAHLRDLEDRYGSTSAYDDLARLEQQITEVSLRYGVLCRFTAFVAIDTRVVTDGGVPHQVTQPVELPSGWEPAGVGLPFDQGRLVGAAPQALSAMPGGPGGPSGPRPAPPAGPRRNSPYGPTATGMGAAPSGPPGYAPSWDPQGMPEPTGMPAPTQQPTGPRTADAAGRSARGAYEGGIARPGGPPGGASVGRPDQSSGDGRLVAVREQLADEVTALWLARAEADAERLRILADLGTRLDSLLAGLDGDPAASEDISGLTELAARLKACAGPGAPRGGDLNALWDEAICLLTDFTQGHAGDAGSGGRRQFWKRGR